MAAIPRDLIESELFGHEKGAFTGANARSVGRFEQAEGGTLFLDEIGDMPMEAQTRLLRVLQQGEYTTVGGRTPIKTNVRIVAATNKDLRHSIQQGLFREDLFFRLNVVPLRLPPLRERTEDIPDLVRHFFQRGVAEGLASEDARPRRDRRLEALSLARQHPRTGEPRSPPRRALSAGSHHRAADRRRIQSSPAVAELDSVQRRWTRPTGRASARGRSRTRHFRQGLEQPCRPALSLVRRQSLPPVGLYHRVVRELEAPLIAATLSATRGNQIKAAEILGLNRNTLRKKIRDLDLKSLRGLK